MGYAIVRNEKGWIAKLLVYAIIAGALYAGYYYFQATPRYTLMQFKKAVSFSDAKTVEKYLDIDRFRSGLPETITGSTDEKAFRDRVLREIDMPYDKPLFASVKKWKTLTIPINIAGGLATIEQKDGTVIELEKITERQWIITSIRFQPQDKGK